MNISIPVGAGELYDKISILEIKSERISNEAKLAYVRNELAALRNVAAGIPVDKALYAELKEMNERLWDIEDAIREEEARQSFGEKFIQLARSVYVTNDRRAEIKRLINLASDSDIVEVKSYKGA
ncbi:MAG: DUF6165 family protein [Chthoniobacter sp.]|nr:DUF6165 family protein [Chthoniobacter sp.]